MNITRNFLGVCRGVDGSRICSRSEQGAQDSQDSQEVSACPELSLASPSWFCVLPVEMGLSLNPHLIPAQRLSEFYLNSP